MGGGGAPTGGGDMEGGGTPSGGEGDDDFETDEGSPDAGEIDDNEFEDVDLDSIDDGEMEAPEEEQDLDFSDNEPQPEPEKNESSYEKFAKNRLSESRMIELTNRYSEASELVYETIMKKFSAFDEMAVNNRHYKYATVENSMETMFRVLKSHSEGKKTTKRNLKEITKGLQKFGYKLEEEEEEKSEISVASMINDFRNEKDMYNSEDDSNMDYDQDYYSEEMVAHRKKNVDQRM